MGFGNFVAICFGHNGGNVILLCFQRVFLK